MTRIPRRVSLVAQVADILRQDLLEGRWSQHLPGEIHLSDLLQVSRSTLRSALHILRREGLIRVSQGRRRWLTPESAQPKRPPSKTIGVVSSLPMHEMPGRGIFVMDELRRHLQRGGFELQLHTLTPTAQRSPLRKLKVMIDQARAACWMLSSCTKELQSWFSKIPAPTLVLGSCYEGIDLPFFTLDYGAACSHAAVTLHRLRHRRIALLLHRSPFAGVVEVEESFRSVISRLLGNRAQPQVRYHDGSVPSIERLVTTLMRMEARPTALIAMRSVDALTIHSHLLNNGFRIPSYVSLISLFDDLSLARVTPSVARYSYNPATFARRLARFVVQMATSQSRPSQPVKIIPECIPGGTIGAPCA